MASLPESQTSQGSRRLLRVGAIAAVILAAALAVGLVPWLLERRLAGMTLPELERRAVDPAASPRLDYYLGEAQRRVGRTRDAVVTLSRAVRRDPGYLPAYAALGRSLLQAGRPADAADIAGRALRVDEQDRDARLVLASALLDQGKAPEAASQALVVAQLYPDSAEAWLVTGSAQAQAGDRPGAEASLGRALELDEKMAEAHRILGDLLLVRNRRVESWAHLERALELAPEDPLVQLVVARWYYLAGGPSELVMARRYLERPLQVRPPRADAYLLFGQVATAQERWAEAIPALQRAAKLAPRDALVFFHLAQAYRDAGRSADAERAFKTYLRLTAGAGKG